ncbi:MAG: site-specific integrase [Bacteroidales bacterium]|nr:site-specific integrase [Bacteroidales bacterium]
MARAYLKLNIRRPLKDGSFPIQLAVGHGKDLYIGTGISCGIEDWNPGDQKCCGENSFLKNRILSSLLSEANSCILRLKEEGKWLRMSNKEIKDALKSIEALPQRKDTRNSLGSLFKKAIELKKGRTASLYADTLKKVEAYCDPYSIDFDDINVIWLEEFSNSLSQLCPNTRNIHLRNLRAVNNLAIDCGLTKNYPFRQFSISSVPTKKKNLSVEVMRQLARVELSPGLSLYRDIFLLSFYLMGINVVDLCHLKELKDGRIEYERAKTHKPYSIKVWPAAQELITKHQGQNQLLKMLDCHKDYRSFYQGYQKGLHKIAKIMGLPRLTSYYCRHTWATIASEIDIPKETIAAGLGHGMGNPITSIYINFDLKKVDEANRQVINHIHNFRDHPSPS